MKLFSSIETQEGYELSVFAETKNNIVTNNYYKGVIVLEENTASSYDICEFDLNNLQDDKVYNKYIEAIKKVCRSSFEYRKFVNFLRENMDMNKCSFFENVSNKESFKIKIELHHAPFTLHDIVSTIVEKRKYFNESLEIEMVAKEVMCIHYWGIVGIIPLSETVHELVHNRLINIPLDSIFGKYQEFIDLYNNFIPDDAKERYKVMCMNSDNQNLDIIKQTPLEVQLIGSKHEGSYNYNKLTLLSNSLNTRILEMKSENNYSNENS